MTLLKAILSHHDALGRRSIEVPEWGAPGAPLVIYWTPMTPGQHASLFGNGLVDARTYVGVVMLKALDAGGKRLFDGSVQTRTALLDGNDLAVVIRVANAITAPFAAPAAA